MQRDILTPSIRRTYAHRQYYQEDEEQDDIGLHETLQPDAALGVIVGTTPLPRTELTKKLWGYIKKRGLQDTTNKRNINADEKLLKVFGVKKCVTMFEMTKLVNKHLK